MGQPKIWRKSVCLFGGFLHTVPAISSWFGCSKESPDPQASQENKTTGFCLSSSQAMQPGYRVPSSKRMCICAFYPMWLLSFCLLPYLVTYQGIQTVEFYVWSWFAVVICGKVFPVKSSPSISELELLSIRNSLSNWTKQNKKTPSYILSNKEIISKILDTVGFVGHRTGEPRGIK